MLDAALILAALLPLGAEGSSSKPPPLPACPPGWKVEVIAEVPVINHPTVVCCAPDGRVFVAEDPMDISEPADQPLGRILCFQADGRTTVFADGLHAVFGMQYLEGKLYVLHNPKLTTFDDSSDGVGRNRTDWIDSTNPNPWALDWNDHIPANFKLAMDGYFYVSVGDKGLYHAKGRDGKIVDLHGGGLVRVRPDATELEVFSTGTRNHLDVAINAEDEVFTYDNTDELDWWSRVTHMVDGGYYGYPWDHKPPRPFILPALADYGAGAATDTVCYNEDALADEYRGNLFLADWGRREVFRLRIARDGGTYRLISREEFLSKGPPDFRPVGLALAPDGTTFFVTDWRHPDVKAKADAGRLLRVSWTGASLAAAKPAWYLPAALGREIDATDDELLAGLRHPSHAVRLCAQRRIAKRGIPLANRAAELAADRSAPASARWHAIWALDAIDGGLKNRSTILALLQDPDRSVRLQAARQLGGRRAGEAVPVLVAMLRESDAAVRVRAAAALGRIADPAAIRPLLDALDEKDLFARQAAFTALNRIGRARGDAWSAIAAGLEDSAPRVREGTLFALRETFDPGVVAGASAFVRDARRPAVPRSEALDLLGELHRKPPEWKGEWWAYHPVNLPRPARTQEWEGTAAIMACLREMLEDSQPEVRRAAVEGLRKAHDASSSRVFERLLVRDKDVEVRRSAVHALTELHDADAAGSVALLLDSSQDPRLALEAVSFAEQVGGENLREALAGLVKARPSNAELLLRAVEALGRVGGEAAVDDLLPLLQTGDAALQKAAASALGGTRSQRALEPLLEAFRRADGDAKLELARSLAPLANVRALDVYLLGLGQKNVAARAVFRTAIGAVKRAALPEIEKLAAVDQLDPQVTLELRRIYSRQRPIKSWRVLGPLPSGAPAPLEDAASGRTETWKAIEALEDGTVDLDRALVPGSRAVAYAAAEVESSSASFVEILAGSGGPLTIWLNGEKVHETAAERGRGAEQESIAVRFRAGANRFLVRVEELGGGAGFSVKAPEGAGGALFEKDLHAPDPAAYRDFALANPGDVSRGRALFSDLKSAGCVKCHAVKGQGGAVGPDLVGIGAQYDRSQLAESVLYPSRVIRGGFEQVVVVTKAGDVTAGAVRSDTADTLTLVDVEGALHPVRKDDIETRETSGLSLMPEGLGTGLSRQDFTDLLSYLESLKS